MSKPTVSIIIPVWNASSNIRYIVDSVLSQSFKNFELILVDDGSTDNTLESLQVAKKNDSRIRVYTKPNGGPSSARNLGLDRAKGKYVQFYDADDNIPPDALSAVVAVAEREGSDLVVSGWQIDLQSPKGLIEGYKLVSPEREVITSNQKDYILTSLGDNGKLYNLWNKLFLNSIIKDSGLRFNEDLRFGEDLIFSMQYMLHAHRLDIIPDITYRYQASSLTSVFALSSLVPAYRRTNDEALLNFAGQNPSRRQRDLTQWIRLRWLMSYWSLVVSSKNSVRHKLALIKKFRPRNLTVPRYTNIGLKKYLLSLIINASRVHPVGSLLLGTLVSFTKKLVIFAKMLVSGLRSKLL